LHRGHRVVVKRSDPRQRLIDLRAWVSLAGKLLGAAQPVEAMRVGVARRSPGGASARLVASGVQGFAQPEERWMEIEDLIGI